VAQAQDQRMIDDPKCAFGRGANWKRGRYTPTARSAQSFYGRATRFMISLCSSSRDLGAPATE
jgi:hypothetical protein